MFVVAFPQQPRYENKLNVHQWMNEEDMEYIYMYPHNGISLSHKKNEIMPFVATGMDPENIMLSETSQKDTNKILWDQTPGLPGRARGGFPGE